MKFQQAISVQDLAVFIDAKIIGNIDQMVHGANEIHKVREGDVTFVDYEKYYQKSIDSEASVIIIDKLADFPSHKTLLLCEKPFLAYEKIIQKHRPFNPWTESKENRTEIHESAIIEPGAFIGQNVRIGARSYVQAGVIIRDFVQIGADVKIESGSVIGTDAFYLKKWPEGYQEWTSGGNVIIEDKVRIGASCTINRGVSGDTIIGYGTKLDCQVQVGHGAVIGKHCLIAAQVGIAGKTVFGDWCTIYGQCGIAQNLTIGNHVTLFAQSGLGANVADGETWFGSPAKPAREAIKEKMVLGFLTKSWEKVRKLL